MIAQDDRLCSFRRIATCGCELFDPNGSVVAWTADEMWAAIIVRLLNNSVNPGVAVVAGMDDLTEATCCRCGNDNRCKSCERKMQVNSTDKNNTREWSNFWGQPLVAIGPWTISKEDDGLRLWQLSHGCQHGVGPVTEGDLEELQVCIRRTLALLSEEVNHG
jgi:hypothetical protein